MDQDETLYERVGGRDGLAGVMTDFYQRVFADDELRPFFADTPVDKLQRMQTEFFAAALEGPIMYSGRPLSEVHAGLGILPRHLRLFLDHLLEALRNRRLSDQDVYEIEGRIAMYADEITGQTSGVDG